MLWFYRTPYVNSTETGKDSRLLMTAYYQMKILINKVSLRTLQVSFIQSFFFSFLHDGGNFNKTIFWLFHYKKFKEPKRIQ